MHKKRQKFWLPFRCKMLEFSVKYTQDFVEKREMVIMDRKYIKWLPIVVGTSLMLSGCQILPAEETFPAAPVIRTYEAEEYKLANVVRGDLSTTKTISCSYVPASQESLCFEVSGEIIKDIYVTSGQEVKKGQLVAELETGDLPEEISQLEYELEVLQIQRNYMYESWDAENQLLEAKYDTETDQYQAQKAVVDAKYILKLESNQDSIHIKELKLQELKKDMSKRKLYATMDGTVIYVRSIQEKEASVEERVMVTIADMDSTAFVVKGDNVQYFEIGDEVIITKSKKEYEAVCVDPSLFGLSDSEKEQKAYFQLVQPDPTLESGNSGQIEVVTDFSEDVLYVNKKAIKTAGGKQFVYVLNADGLRETKDVTVGKEFGNVIEVLSGLSEGESVLLD